MEQREYTVLEAAQVLGKSPEMIRRAIREGKLNARQGEGLAWRQYMIAADELERYRQEQVKK